MRIYPIFIPHAGCPHRCFFCAQDRSTSHATVPSGEQVCAWLDKTLPQHGAGEIAFYGGTFTLLPQEQQELYLGITGRFVSCGRASGIRISTRPDAIDAQAAMRLRAAGVTTLELGCQSFNDAVLTAAGRGHSGPDNVAAIRSCLDAGLQLGVQLMPGLPRGDRNEALQSLRHAIELKPMFVRIYPTVVVDGTQLAELWKTGHYKPWSLDEAVDVCADMLHLCRQHDLLVIRLGLQTDPRLEENILDGPYHPAFGQLVRSRLWRRALHQAGAHDKQVTVHPADLSDVLGHRCENREWLKRTDPAMTITTDQTVARETLRASGRDWRLHDLSAQGGHHG